MEQIEVSRQLNGQYTVIMKDEEGKTVKTENLSREDAEIFVRAQEGMTEEKVASIFGSSAEPAKVSQNQKVNGQPNSVFAREKAKTGLSNAGVMKTEEQYKQMEQELLSQLKTQYSAGTAERMAKGKVETQRAADRVESSVYFTPAEKEEFEKQKEQLEKEGKRPVLLTNEDMELLHSDNFVLRNGKGEPIDKDGNVIKRNDPDAKSKYVTAFNEDGSLNQDMVKLISAQRVGSDNELEHAERDAETRQLRTDIEGGVVTKDKSKPTVDLYERLGYDVKKEDDAIAAAAGDIRKARNKGRGLGALIGAGLGTLLGAVLREFSKTKTMEKVGEEEVTIKGQTHTVDGGQSTITTVTEGETLHGEQYWVEGEQEIHHVTVNGGVYDVTVTGAGHWEQGEDTIIPGDTVTQTVDNGPIEVQDDDITYMQDVYGEKEVYGLSAGEAYIPTTGLGAGLGAFAGDRIAKHRAEKAALAAAAENQEEEDIFVTMEHREAAVNAFYNGEFKGISGEHNQEVMQKIVEAAKAKNMTQEEFAKLMKIAAGSNEVMTEKELMKFADMVNQVEEVEETDRLEEEDEVDPKYDTAKVIPQEVEEEVSIKNTAYKMQKGDIIANVVRAKYGITDPKDLREAIRAVRRATGMPESGLNADGSLAIAHLEVDGKTLMDAYYLPEKLTINGKDYDLDMSKDGKKETYTKRGTKFNGTSVETRVKWNGTSYEVRTVQGNKLLGTYKTESEANEVKQRYDDEKHVIEEE